MHIAMLYFSALWMLKHYNLAGHLTMSIVILVSCPVSALGIVAPVVVVDTYQLTQSLESRRRDNRSHCSSERERGSRRALRTGLNASKLVHT